MHRMLHRSIAAVAIGAVGTLGAAAAAGAQGVTHANTSILASAKGAPGGPPGSIPGPFGQPSEEHAVFVQTDNTSGNAIDVLDEHADGRLSLRDVVSTGGLGGQTAGSEADHLASQGSLTYDAREHLLFSVNAGSDSLSVLSAQGQDLRLDQVVSSGGEFPDSVAVYGDLVYVLDAGGSGTITGYRISGDRLVALAGSSRTLGLSNAPTPTFLTSPGQVGFSPNGSELIVTTKASTSSLEVFGVGSTGLLTATPKVTADTGNVPFSFTFSPSGQLVVAEAANSTLHTYALGVGGSLTSLSASVPDGQTALCWITPVGSHYYVANAGSSTVSAYSVASNGTPSLVGTTGVVATTDAGPIDMAASADGSTLYVEAGVAGAVDELHVNADGTLSDLGSVAGLGAGIEGIAAD